MTEKENPLYKIYHQTCLYYTSRQECKSCNGFGENSDKNVNTQNCYATKEQIEEYLDVKNYPLGALDGKRII